MKSASFANFQAGIVDDPSNERVGGFEFASGMDIFSEPGVLKACQQMMPVSFGGGAAPSALPNYMADTTDVNHVRAYIIAGAKVLESTDGVNWSLFITNANGLNWGLGIFNGYVIYASSQKLGRVQVANAGTQNDNFSTLNSDEEYHPMVLQAGTLKIGDGRYIGSLDEGFTHTLQAMKLPSGYRIKTLAEYLTRLFIGTKFGLMSEPITFSDASVFDWRGILLSSGTALPDTPYPLKMLGMNALHYNGKQLLGFPGQAGDIHALDGVQFVPFRKIHATSMGNSTLSVRPGAVCQLNDASLFAGDMIAYPGVFQMKGNVICQSYLPSTATPGETGTYQIGLLKSSFGGRVIMGYYRAADASYHLEIDDTSNKQNNAFVKTVWHRISHIRGVSPDRYKKWIGVKLNLKSMASGCSVAVGYRTNRDVAFTDSGVTVSNTNQNSPVIFSAQPRSREIQFKFTFTTNGNNTPELLSYEPLFEILKTNR